MTGDQVHAEATFALIGSSARNDPLVLIMRPDPEPISCIALNVGQGAVIGIADSNRPNFKFYDRHDELIREAFDSSPRI